MIIQSTLPLKSYFDVIKCIPKLVQFMHLLNITSHMMPFMFFSEICRKWWQWPWHDTWQGNAHCLASQPLGFVGWTIRVIGDPPVVRTRSWQRRSFPRVSTRTERSFAIPKGPKGNLPPLSSTSSGGSRTRESNYQAYSAWPLSAIIVELIFPADDDGSNGHHRFSKPHQFVDLFTNSLRRTSQTVIITIGFVESTPVEFLEN